MSFSAFNPYVNAVKIDKVAEHQSSSDTVLESLYDQVQDIAKYSTDEHVVGEWVDGSPIYEKTITGNPVYTTSGSGSWTAVNVGTEVGSKYIYAESTTSGGRTLLALGTNNGDSGGTAKISLLNANIEVNITALTIRYIKPSANTISE